MLFLQSTVVFCLLLAISLGADDIPAPHRKDVKCAVCRSLVSEFHSEISKVDPRRRLTVGSYRLQSDGEQKTQERLYAGSETHLTDVMETVCSVFSDYAQARHKGTGEMEVISIVGKDGKMNPNFGDYDMIPDPDLNKSLEYHCQTIVEDFEDDILEHFSTGDNTQDVTVSQHQFCVSNTRVCPSDGAKLEL